MLQAVVRVEATVEGFCEQSMIWKNQSCLNHRQGVETEHRCREGGLKLRCEESVRRFSSSGVLASGYPSQSYEKGVSARVKQTGMLQESMP